jgi:hypothetical protein
MTKEIFEKLKCDKNFDKNYLLINNADYPETKKAHDFSKKLYQLFHSLSLDDDHFLSQIKVQWQQRFWEMYLACTLDNFNFKLSSKNEGPDLLIEKNHINHENIWVEAVCSSRGNGSFSVEELSFNEDGNIKINATDEKVILRLLSSLKDKNEKFTKYRHKYLISEKDPCIIAINAYELHKVSLINPNSAYILNALFPIGDMQYNFSIDDISYSYKPSINKGEVEISTKIFSTNDYEYISAIIYSEVSAYDYGYKLGYDYMIIHNPFAKNPINSGIFKIGKEVVMIFSESGKAKFQIKDWNN